MVRGRPRLKCNNCFYGKPGRCQYLYPGGPCSRCQEQGLVCGGVPARDEPTPPGKVRPVPRAPASSRVKKDPSVAPPFKRMGRPSNASRASMAESVSSGSSKMAVDFQLAKGSRGSPSKAQAAGNDSSDLSAPDDDDSDDEQLFSSESDDPDDKPFRPAYVPRPRARASVTRGSPFVAPAPEVDRTTRSHLAGVSKAPRSYFKRGLLPPQAGPMSNKRPRSGNPAEFFQPKGRTRDIHTEDGETPSPEVDDLERLGLYLRPPPADPDAATSRSGTLAATETRKTDKGKQRAVARNRLELVLRKESEQEMLPPPRIAPLAVKRSGTWVSLRVPSPRADDSSRSSPSPSGPSPPLPTDPAVLHHLSEAMHWQKQALMAPVLASILDAFKLQGLSISARDLEDELVKTAAFAQAIEARAKQILVRGLRTLDAQVLTSAANPPPSPSRLKGGRERRLSSISQSPSMDLDIQFMSNMVVGHLVTKILTPLISAICTACASVGGIVLDEPAFAQQIQDGEDGAIYLAARREARVQLAQNLLTEELGIVWQ